MDKDGREEYEYLDFQQTYFTWWRADDGYSWEQTATVENKPMQYPAKHTMKFWRDTTKDEALKKQYAEMLKNTYEMVELPPPYLVPTDDTRGFIEYRPLDDTKMFLTLASIEPTKDAIREFANEYGNLTDRILVKRETDGEFRKGDSFSTWQEEIEDLSWTSRVWEWQRSDKDNPPNKKNLRKVIYWADDGSLQYVLADESTLSKQKKAEELITAIENGTTDVKHYIRGVLVRENDEIMSRFRKGDSLLPAQYLVQTIINHKLLYHNVRPRLLVNSENKLEPRLVPESLIGAIWLQFYIAAAGEKRYKRCGICGNWEDITDRTPKWRKHPVCANRARVKKRYYKEKNEQQNAIMKGRGKK